MSSTLMPLQKRRWSVMAFNCSALSGSPVEAKVLRIALLILSSEKGSVVPSRLVMIKES